MSTGPVQIAAGPVDTQHAAQQARLLRTALGCYPTGVTIVTTRSPDGRMVGLTVNSFASLSLDPPLLLWSLSNKSPNLRAFRAASGFAVNVLAVDQQALAARFATAHIVDKFDGVAVRPNNEPQHENMPLIAGAAAHFVCASRDAIETGDHTLFIGRVSWFHGSTQAPLVYHAGGFAKLDVAQSLAEVGA